MTLDPARTAVLALHWQVNVTKPDGFFGAMLAEPVARSGVITNAARFHAAARAAGVLVAYTRFTVPEGEGALVRNTGFMQAVAAAQLSFRPDAPGAAIIPELPVAETDLVVDNQRLSGLAASGLPDELSRRGIDTVLITGVATNLTVEQTARHATDLGLTVHVVSDCVTTATPEIHQASLDNLELTTAGCRTADALLAELPSSRATG